MSTIPPTQPALDAMPRPQSSWPMVIGCIAIIIAALGIVQYLVCAPIGLAMMGLFEGFLDKAAQAQPGAGLEIQQAQFEAMRPYTYGNLATGCAAGALSVMLLVGGIGLIRRRPSAGPTLKTWAVLKILLAIPAVLVGYYMNAAMFEAMAEAAATSGGGPGAPPAGIFNLMGTFGAVGSLISLLFYWALPTFMLIWFARARIRAEVAEWQQPEVTA